eukprot:snap_masked-scaffold_43-processed-gene-0.16-mRNA-1 protein AED:1.00 eAED:1.00 QI:0/0/0/0/1/1/2/0/490
MIEVIPKEIWFPMWNGTRDKKPIEKKQLIQPEKGICLAPGLEKELRVAYLKNNELNFCGFRLFDRIKIGVVSPEGSFYKVLNISTDYAVNERTFRINHGDSFLKLHGLEVGAQATFSLFLENKSPEDSFIRCYSSKMITMEKEFKVRRNETKNSQFTLQPTESGFFTTEIIIFVYSDEVQQESFIFKVKLNGFVKDPSIITLEDEVHLETALFGSISERTIEIHCECEPETVEAVVITESSPFRVKIADNPDDKKRNLIVQFAPNMINREQGFIKNRFTETKEEVKTFKDEIILKKGAQSKRILVSATAVVPLLMLKSIRAKKIQDSDNLLLHFEEKGVTNQIVTLINCTSKAYAGNLEVSISKAPNFFTQPSQFTLGAGGTKDVEIKYEPSVHYKRKERLLINFDELRLSEAYTPNIIVEGIPLPLKKSCNTRPIYSPFKLSRQAMEIEAKYTFPTRTLQRKKEHRDQYIKLLRLAQHRRKMIESKANI